MQKVRQGYKLVENFFHSMIEIPEHWSYPKFSEVVKVNPSTKIEEKQIPYLPMDAVDVEKPNFRYFEERDLVDFPSLPKFQENDVLFASITPSTENGKTCIIENFSRKGIGSSELTILRPTDKVIPRYLYYYVKSHRIRQFAISQMMGTTGRQRVPDYVFKKDLNFELPPEYEQQKIASILSNVDSLINQTQKIIDQTQRLKKGLMQQLLTRGIGHTKFKHIELIPKYLSFDIPEEWEEVFFADVSKRITYGFTNPMPESEDGPWMITATNIKNGKIDYCNARKTTKKAYDDLLTDKSRPKTGFVLVTKDGTLGETAIVDRDDICINQSVAFLEPNLQKISSEFLFLSLQTEIIRKIIGVFSPQTTIRHISITDLAKWKLGLPSKSEQQKIVYKIHNFNNKLNTVVSYKSKLDTLKKGLMQKLLTGQIRVNV